jgi:hypothetical protein
MSQKALAVSRCSPTMRLYLISQLMSEKVTSIIMFKQNGIRRHWDDLGKIWYFSIVDVIAVLTESTVPRRYWSDLKKTR